MKQITSNHNQLYKELKQLATSAKYRRQAERSLLEGVHLCQAFLQFVGRPLSLVYTESATEDAEVRQIIQACSDLSVPMILLSGSHFRVISSVDNGLGLMFVIANTPQNNRATLDSSALLLESVQDPGNLGSILRTAAAAGVIKVFISPGSSSAWSPRVLRAGMGAHFGLDIYENCDLAELISTASVPVLATSLDAKSTVYQQDLSSPTAWLFGNEGSGVSEGLLSLAVRPVIIPQNPQVESLGVAAAVAVCLFEQSRQTNKS